MMWFPTNEKIHAKLDSIIGSLKRSDQRLSMWEDRPSFLPDGGLNQVISTLRVVLDDILASTTEVSLALSFGQLTARQVLSNLKPASQLANQIREKLDELDAGAAVGRAAFEQSFGSRHNAANR